MTLSDDGTRLFVKDNTGLIVIDVNAWAITQTLRFPKKNDGGSMVGIAAGPGGKAILTTADGELVIAGPKPDGAMAWEKQIPLKGKVKGTSFPCGVAITADGAFAYVCLSRDNTLVRVDLERGVIERSIDVGVAPYEVKLSADGTRAYVSNWGGRHPENGERSALSSGTLALVDERGVATSGTVTEIDLASWNVVREVEVGRSASAVAILDSGAVAVTASNDDRLVLVRGEERRVFSTRPDEALPFGSMPNGLVQVPRDSSSLGGKVLVANAGNNALAVMDPASGEIAGLIPTAWYPGPVAVSRTHAFVGCINGVGSRTPRKDQKGWNSHLASGHHLAGEAPGRQRTAGVHDASEGGCAAAADPEGDGTGRVGGQGGVGAGAGGPEVGLRARGVHHQGEPNVRPGVRGLCAGQLGPVAVHLRAGGHPESARACRAVRDPGQLLLQRRALGRRALVGDRGDLDALSPAELRRVRTELHVRG
jgi:DNA-binding beta-propeller fold protein YncE